MAPADTMPPPELLSTYCANFFGFGSWKAPVWFVGVEEAGGATQEEVQRRLETWHQFGERDLEDAPIFYPACGNQRWHGPAAVLQPTWKQLIRMLLLARGKSDHEGALLDLQRDRLGTLAGDTCLAELLPLPSPNTNDWQYSEWSDLPWLQSRAAYVERFSVPRTDVLHERIAEYRPAVVILYGTEIPGLSLLPIWSRIAEGWFDQAIAGEKILLWRQSQGTLFFVTNHPGGLAEGADERFRRIGHFMRLRHGDRFRV